MQHNIFTIICMLFVSFLLTSNIIGPKPIIVFNMYLPIGVFIFPITYMLGAIVTEVYGFKASRIMIWTGLACNLILAIGCKIAVIMPSSPLWENQQAYATVLDSSSRIMLCSIFAYALGEFTNAIIIAWLKLKLNGRFFILRAVFGNWIGETIETIIFLPLAFYSIGLNNLIPMIITYLTIKYIYAVIAMPIVARICTYLQNYNSSPQPTAHAKLTPLQAFQD